MANDAMWVIYDARSREQGARPGTAAAARVYCKRGGGAGGYWPREGRGTVCGPL